MGFLLKNEDTWKLTMSLEMVPARILKVDINRTLRIKELMVIWSERNCQEGCGLVKNLKKMVGVMVVTANKMSIGVACGTPVLRWGVIDETGWHGASACVDAIAPPRLNLIVTSSICVSG